MSAEFSLVIATFERPDDLAITLGGVERQISRPMEIIVVDSSADARTRSLCEQWGGRLPVRWVKSDARSAARQRNAGAELTSAASAVIGFMDDDITLHPDTCALVTEVFAGDTAGEVGGVAVRIDEIERPPPSMLARCYYHLQAGYPINCLPCYTEPAEAGGNLIRAEWLNSGCVFYRREPFLRERFPAFEGYSFMEDVHLSARIARTHRLYFHTRARCSHRDGTNSLKKDFAGLARQRIRNQRIVAREVMGLHGLPLAWKFLLHRLFASVTILRQHRLGWTRELIGTWT
jgi:glycosyltransferase involved in cell wall biosynthesis